MRYSLANYILTIANDNSDVNSLFGNVQIGGEGDAVSSITVNHETNLWSTEGYATGAWVHNKNLDRHGTVEISMSQLTDAVAKFKQFVNLFYSTSDSNDVQGSTLTLSDTEGNVIAVCEDCYPTRIPSQQFGNTAGVQNWSFTAGRITIY